MTRHRAPLLRFVLLLALLVPVRGSLEAAEILGLTWPSHRAGYLVNPNFPEPEIAGDTADQVALIRCGANAWHEQTLADFEFSYDGTTTRSGVDTLDGENIVSWIRFDGDGALAATFFRPATEGEFGGFDLVFYSDRGENPIHWSGLGEPPLGTEDIRGIATHEFGHALGLGHVLEPEATMFAASRQRGLILRTLHELDRGCVEGLYGLRPGSLPGVALGDVDPSFGPTLGGNEVTIFGGNFTYESESRLSIGGIQLDRSLWRVELCGRLRIAEMPPRGPGLVDIRLENSLGAALAESAYEYQGDSLLFLRGDANRDGSVDISDSLAVLGNLFLGDPEELECEKSADTNDSSTIDLSDAVKILDHLFNGGDAPREPYPFCGEDPTQDGLFCVVSGCD